MGERYQIHTIFEFDTVRGKETELYSTHLQWCWDVHIVRNLYRLMHTLKNTIDLYTWDGVDDYIKGILTVNKNLDGKFYPYNSFVESPYLTDEGDSNRGWAVLKIKINRDGDVCEVLSCFYDISGVEQTKKELLTDCEKSYLYYDYKDWEQVRIKEMLDSGLFCNTKINLQKEFNGLVKEIREKEKEKEKG